MDTLSLDLKYLKDLEECMDDGDSKITKEAKLFDTLEHKSVVIEVDNKKIAIFSKAPLRAFGEPFMRYSIPCKVDGKGAWDAELDLVDSTNYVTKEVLENMGFDKYREIRINLTKFKEGIEVIDLTEEVGSSSREVVKMRKANGNKSYNINKFTPPPFVRLTKIPPTSIVPPQPIYHPLIPKQKEKMKEKMCDLRNYVFPMKINGVVEMVALVDTGASVSVLPFSLYNDLRLGRDEDGNVKYGLVAPSFINIEDDMERSLAMKAYFNPLKNDVGYELDGENTCLKKEAGILTKGTQGSSGQRQEHEGLNTSWGDWNASLRETERGNVWRYSMMIQNNYMPILHHLADQVFVGLARVDVYGGLSYPSLEGT
nr:hypothetical protein [Tanacetum cinerariifolium]